MYIGSNVENFKKRLDDGKICLKDTLCSTICICATYNENEIKIECDRLSNILK